MAATQAKWHCRGVIMCTARKCRTWFSAGSFPELKGEVMMEGNFGKLIVSNYVVIFIALLFSEIVLHSHSPPFSTRGTFSLSFSTQKAPNSNPHSTFTFSVHNYVTTALFCLSVGPKKPMCILLII